MSAKQALRDDIRRSVEGDAWHGPSVKEALADVAARDAAARAGAVHSIWELTLHIAAWMEEVADRLEGRYHDEPLVGNFPATGVATEQEWSAAVARLDESLARLSAAIDAFPEDRLTEEIRPGLTWWRTLTGVAQHNTYHAGQIALLTKL